MLLAAPSAWGEEEELDVFAVLRSSFVTCRPIGDDPEDTSGVTKRVQEVAKGCPGQCASEEELKRYKKALGIVCKIIGVKDVASIEAKYLGQGEAPCRPPPAALQAAKPAAGGPVEPNAALEQGAVKARAKADAIAKALAGKAKRAQTVPAGGGDAAAPGALSDETLADIVYSKLSGAKDPAAAMKEIDDFLESQGIKGEDKEAALAAIREIAETAEAEPAPARASPQPQTAKKAAEPRKKVPARPGGRPLLDAAENAAEALLPNNPFLIARRRDERTERLAMIAEMILGGTNGDAELTARVRAALSIPDLARRAGALRPLLTEADSQFQRRLAMKRDARLRERRIEKCAGQAKDEKKVKACLKSDWTPQEVAQAVKEALDADPDLGLYLSTRRIHQQAIMEQMKDGKLWAGLKLEPWEVQDGLAPPGARSVEVGQEEVQDKRGGKVAGLRFDLGGGQSVFEGLRTAKGGLERITIAGDAGKQVYRAETVRLGANGRERVVRVETRMLKDGKLLQSTVVQGATTVVKDFNRSGSVWRMATEERKGKAVRKVVVDAKAQRKTTLDFDGTITLENTKPRTQLTPDAVVKTVGKVVDGQFRHTRQEFAGGGKQVGHWHARLNRFVPDEISEGGKTYFRDKSLSAKKEEDLFNWQGGKSGKEFLLLDRQMWFEQVNKIVDADGTKHWGRVEKEGPNRGDWIEERSLKPDGSGSIRIKGKSGEGMLAYTMSLTEAVGKNGVPFDKLLAAAGAYASRSGLDKAKALPIAQWLFDQMAGARTRNDDDERIEYLLAGSAPSARFSLVTVVHANVVDSAQTLVGSQPEVSNESVAVWAKAGDSLQVPYRALFEKKLASDGASDLTVLRGHDKRGVAYRLYMLDGTMWQRKRGYAFTAQGVVTSEKKHTRELLAKFRRDSGRKWVSKCKRDAQSMVEDDDYSEIHMQKNGGAVVPVVPCEELMFTGPHDSQTTASGVVGSVLSEAGEVPGIKQLGQFGAGVFHCTAGAGRGAVAMGGNLEYRLAEISSYHSCGGFENHSILAMVDKDKEVKAGVDVKVAENLKKDLGSDCDWMGEGECRRMVEQQIEALKRTKGNCGEVPIKGKKVALNAYACQRLRVVGYAYSADHAMDEGGVASVLGVAMQAGETAASSLPMMVGAGGAQTLGRGFGASGMKLNKAVMNEFTALHRAGMVDAAFMKSLKAMGGPGMLGKTVGAMGTLGNQYISATAFLGTIDNAGGCITESGSAKMKACTAMAVDAVTFAKPLGDKVREGRQTARDIEALEWDARKKIATGEFKPPPPPAKGRDQVFLDLKNAGEADQALLETALKELDIPGAKIKGGMIVLDLAGGQGSRLMKKLTGSAIEPINGAELAERAQRRGVDSLEPLVEPTIDLAKDYQPLKTDTPGSQGDVYRSRDGGTVVKIFKEQMGVGKAELAELQRIYDTHVKEFNEQMAREGKNVRINPAQVVSVMTPHGPKLAVKSPHVEGTSMHEVIDAMKREWDDEAGDYSEKGKKMHEQQKAAGAALDAIDRRTGGLADRHGLGQDGKRLWEDDYSNFVVKDGMLINVDPINIRSLKEKLAKGETAKPAPQAKPAPGPEAVVDAAELASVRDPAAERGLMDTLRDMKAQAAELVGGKPALPEAKVLGTLSTDGASGPVLEARLPDGQVAAVKQYSETGPAADANFVHEVDMARRMDEALRSQGMAPRFLGEVKVPGEGRAFAMEKIDGKPIHELTAKEAETLLSADTVRQIRDGVQALKDAGLGGKDSPQAMILTKDQLVNGKARKAGDVVFIDAGQLSADSRSWDPPGHFADAAADQVALARAGRSKHPGETIDQLAMRRRGDRDFERKVDEARLALNAEPAGPVKVEPMTASAAPPMGGGRVAGAAARIKNILGGFFGRRAVEELPSGGPEVKPAQAPVVEAKPQARTIDEVKPQYKAYMEKLMKEAFAEADAAAKSGKKMPPIYMPPLGGFHQYSIPGQPAPPYQGPKLHVSAAPKDALRVAELVGDYLRKEKVEHKFPSAANLQTFLGDSHATQGGKFITIYPKSPADGLRLAREIDAMLAKNGIGSEGAQLPPDFLYPGRSGLVTSRPGRVNGRPSGKVFDVDGVEMDPRRVKEKGLRDDYIRDAEGKVMVDEAGRPILDQRDNGKANLVAMIKGGVLKPDTLDSLRKMGWPVDEALTAVNGPEPSKAPKGAETADPMKAVPSGPLGVVAGNAGGRAYTKRMFKSIIGLDEPAQKILDQAQAAAKREIAENKPPGTNVVGTLSNETIGVQSLSDCGVRGLWNLPELRPARDAMMGDYNRFLDLAEKITNKPLRDKGATAADLRLVLERLGYKMDFMQLPASAEGLIGQLHASGGSLMGSIDVRLPSFAGTFKHGLVVNGAIRGADGQWRFVVSDSNFKRPQLYSFAELQAMELIVGKVERAADAQSTKPLSNDQIIGRVVDAHNQLAATRAPQSPPSLPRRAWRAIFGQPKDDFAPAPQIELGVGEVPRGRQAEAALGRKLDATQRAAVEEAHEVGTKQGEKGRDGGPAAIGNYTRGQIERKYRILREKGGFNAREARTILEKGIAGIDPKLLEGLDVKQTTAEPTRSGDGGHGGNVSVEEISRPYDYFVIDKNGRVTPRGIGKMAKNIDLSKGQILALRDPKTGRIEIHGALDSPAAQRRVDQYFKSKYPDGQAKAPKKEP